MFKKLLAFFAAMYVAMSFAAVDVNKASAADLDGLKGIGPAISGKIIEERKKGDFKDWNDFIDRVKGVGQNNAAKFSAEGLTVGGAAFKGAPASPAAASKKDNKPAAAAKANEKQTDAKPAAAVAAAPVAAAEKKDPKAEAKAKADEAKAKKAEEKKAKADETKKAAEEAKAKAGTAKSAASAAKK